MGTEYPCGCRTSMGHYFPCEYHEIMLEDEWTKESYDKEYLKKIEKRNKELKKVV